MVAGIAAAIAATISRITAAVPALADLKAANPTAYDALIGASAAVATDVIRQPDPTPAPPQASGALRLPGFMP